MRFSFNTSTCTSVLSVVGMAVNCSALQMTDFLPFVHLHVQFAGQLNVQSSLVACDAMNSSKTAKRKNRKKRKDNEQWDIKIIVINDTYKCYECEKNTMANRNIFHLPLYIYKDHHHRNGYDFSQSILMHTECKSGKKRTLNEQIESWKKAEIPTTAKLETISYGTLWMYWIYVEMTSNPFHAA